MADSKLQVENPLNRPMHYGNDGTLVGVLPTPAALPQKLLYSGYVQSRIYHTLVQDLYSTQKTATPKKKGMPKIIKIVLGTIGAIALWAALKPGAIKLFNKILRRG